MENYEKYIILNSTAVYVHAISTLKKKKEKKFKKINKKNLYTEQLESLSATAYEMESIQVEKKIQIELSW